MSWNLLAAALAANIAYVDPFCGDKVLRKSAFSHDRKSTSRRRFAAVRSRADKVSVPIEFVSLTLERVR